MPNLTIYNGENSQQVKLSGLTDNNGTLISSATVTGVLYRSGAALAGGSLTFAPVSGSPGDYVANLSNFDAPQGRAELVINGSNNSAEFKYTEYVTIADRTL